MWRETSEVLDIDIAADDIFLKFLLDGCRCAGTGEAVKCGRREGGCRSRLSPSDCHKANARAPRGNWITFWRFRVAFCGSWQG